MRFERTWNAAHVRHTRELPGPARLIQIVPDSGARSYPPGSHIEVQVRIDGGEPDVRHYSLVGDQPTAGAYRIAVKRHDDSRGGSEYMHALQAGDRLSISDPQNLFPLSFGTPEYLLIAGGIGITPIVGMSYVLARRQEPFRLLYAARTRGEMPFVDELSERLGSRLAVCASDEGRRIDVAAEVAALHPQGELYVCGPYRLLEACRREWAAAGRPAVNLRMETFADSGKYAPEPFVVHVADYGRDVEVPQRRTMLSALREAGIEVMYDCLRGECGLCAVEVLEVEGEIDHRDVFLSQDEREQGRRLCTCVSRVVRGGVTVDTGYRARGVAPGREHKLFDVFSGEVR